jgi:hypothetical protein
MFCPVATFSDVELTSASFHQSVHLAGPSCLLVFCHGARASGERNMFSNIAVLAGGVRMW